MKSYRSSLNGKNYCAAVEDVLEFRKGKPVVQNSILVLYNCDGSNMAW